MARASLRRPLWLVLAGRDRARDRWGWVPVRRLGCEVSLWALKSGCRWVWGLAPFSWAGATGQAGQPETLQPTSSKPASNLSAQPCLPSSRKRWLSRQAATRLPRSSWRPSVVALTLCALLLLGPAAGCCSATPTTLPAPRLPAGAPRDRSKELLVLEAHWKDQPDGTTSLPSKDLEFLLAERLLYRARVRALEAAGRWRK